MVDKNSPKLWFFTVIRTRGLHLLRPEKSWRPIVTVVVDDHQFHETILGCDGQNPNLKLPFALRSVNVDSRVNIQVFHRSQSKKKGKKRNLVATASLSLGDLLKIQGTDPKLEINLNATTRQQRGSSRGRTNTACVIAKLQPPTQSGILSRSNTYSDVADSMMDENLSNGELTETEVSSCQSRSESDRPWVDDFGGSAIGDFRIETLDIKGYWSDSHDAQSEEEKEPLLQHGAPRACFDDEETGESSTDMQKVRQTPTKDVAIISWIAASILPTYSEQMAPDPSVSVMECFVDRFSPYWDLRNARVDSDFEKVLSKLQAEWSFVGASLVALAGLDAAVFGFSSGSLFSVDSLARRAIALGSISSGIGIALDAWFLLAYSGANASKFRNMARDVYGTYMFFCISARMPALCMFASACALMVFLLCVSWSAWPTAVLVMSFLAGTIVSLQFIVYGVHCVVRSIFELGRAFLRVVAVVARKPPPDAIQKDTPSNGE
ncbi:hypothetical protein SERLA73DRAFT_73063 [Serpula lacrymans var. lacrymans S7.3]|uniref:C2 domain-containing protein n=1 Tax=Serpula lacrymans var. lacrymans (strain S7.3) TaxID=936435 RepID=F8PWM5_SERL3|nr:hypothetical protein SERLA73DRAFT_73063 [Serpula lacrymans var. lacrymans S7.3]